jgi:hypothetical protein
MPARSSKWIMPSLAAGTGLLKGMRCCGWASSKVPATPIRGRAQPIAVSISKTSCWNWFGLRIQPRRATKEHAPRLWERCQGQDSQVSPFGIIFRSTGTPPASPPFATWSYLPLYLPQGLAIQIAEGTRLDEPELFYLPFLRRGAAQRPEPTSHALPIRRIQEISVGLRDRNSLSAASRCAERLGLVRYFDAPRPLLEILFEGPGAMRIDVRPELPLLFRGAANGQR